MNLIGKNLATELWRLTERWNIDFHNHYIQMLYHQANELDGKRLIFFTAITFAYAALFFVEGIGLILGKYWAQWLVIIDTASFIPGEIFYLARQFSWFNTFLLLINLKPPSSSTSSGGLKPGTARTISSHYKIPQIA